MELGVSTALGVEAGPRTPRTGAPQRAITEHILGLADRAGYGAALINAADATVTTWPQFAYTIRAAARGLSRRGLQDTDTVGVLVEDAVSHAVAVHAIRAAGAIAWPFHQAAGTAEIAAQLKACRARLLITSAGLAGLAIQAAERSWVRQVFAFGEAEGTTPFSSLLEAARHGQPDKAGGISAGPGSITALILGLAGLTSGPRMTRTDVVIAGPPCGEGHVYTSLLDLSLAAGATIVAAAATQIAAAMDTYKGTAVIVPRGIDVPGAPAGLVFSVLSLRPRGMF